MTANKEQTDNPQPVELDISPPSSMNEYDSEEEKKQVGSDWLGSQTSVNEEEDQTDARDKDLGVVTDS